MSTSSAGGSGATSAGLGPETSVRRRRSGWPSRSRTGVPETGIQKAVWSAGPNRPGDLRVLGPKASAPRRIHPKKRSRRRDDPKQASKAKPSGGDFAAARGFLADASFGASPVVASALGATPDATPAWRIEHTTAVANDHPKPELSTLPQTGSFYFALTRVPEKTSHASSINSKVTSAQPRPAD